MTRAAGTSQPSVSHPGAAIAAMALGVAAMGASPVFVRLADVGPYASAFWRVALALPALWVWMHWEAQRGARPAGRHFDRLVSLAGVLFAGDLFFWHLAITHTTVANATFLAALAPIAVVAGAWAILGERVGAPVLAGLVLGLAGAGFLLGSSYTYSAGSVAGDAFGLVTACFFGAYVLAVRPARRRHPPGALLFHSTIVTALVLLAVSLALEPRLLPNSAEGVAVLVALALVSHAGGQGLMAFALGHLPAGFSSLVIFLEGIVAAILGWAVLSEGVTWLQLAGCALIIAGIWVARPRESER